MLDAIFKRKNCSIFFGLPFRAPSLRFGVVRFYFILNLPNLPSRRGASLRVIFLLASILLLACMSLEEVLTPFSFFLPRRTAVSDKSRGRRKEAKNYTLSFPVFPPVVTAGANSLFRQRKQHNGRREK